MDIRRSFILEDCLRLDEAKIVIDGLSVTSGRNNCISAHIVPRRFSSLGRFYRSRGTLSFNFFRLGRHPRHRITSHRYHAINPVRHSTRRNSQRMTAFFKFSPHYSILWSTSSWFSFFEVGFRGGSPTKRCLQLFYSTVFFSERGEKRNEKRNAIFGVGRLDDSIHFEDFFFSELRVLSTTTKKTEYVAIQFLSIIIDIYIGLTRL